MAKKTDLIRVDGRFADRLRRVSLESGESMIDITASIPLNGGERKKRRSKDPFDLTVI